MIWISSWQVSWDSQCVFLYFLVFSATFSHTHTHSRSIGWHAAWGTTRNRWKQSKRTRVRKDDHKGGEQWEKIGGSLEISINTHRHSHKHTHTHVDQVWRASSSYYANQLSDYCIMSLNESVISSCDSGSFIGRDEVLTSQSQCCVVLWRLSALLPWQHAI